MQEKYIDPKNIVDNSTYQFVGHEELAINDKYLLNYNRDLIKKMSSYATQAKKVLEFGAGIGTLALEWEKQTQIQPKCLEIDQKLSEVICKKGLFCYLLIHEVKEQFDVIYSSNVLEHIEDDIESLKQLHSLLKPNGTIIIFVPAFMCLYSNFDKIAEHFRRYEKKELISKIKIAGFEPIKCHYVDSIGFFGFLYLKFFGYKRGKNLGSVTSFKIYDKYIYPISRFFDYLGFKYFLGKNLFLVAKKIGK
jgi:SAM-dependent methyltransferase